MSAIDSEASGRPRAAGGFLEFFFLSFGYVALQMALAPLRIRLLTEILGKETYGAISLVLLLVNFAVIFLSLGTFEFLIRRLPGQREEAQFATFGMLIRVFLPAAILCVAVAVPVVVLGLADPRFGWAECLLSGLGLILHMALNFRVYFLLGTGRLLHFRLLQLLSLDLWFFALLFVYLFFPELGIVRVLAVWVGVLALALVIGERWVPSVTSLRAFREQRMQAFAASANSDASFGQVLAFSVPLLPLVLGEAMFRLTDRVVVTAFLGLERMAEYTLTMNIALIVFMVGLNIVSLVLPALNGGMNALTREEQLRPWASAELRELFTTMFRFALILALFGGAVLIFLGDQVLGVLAAREYRNVGEILIWAAPASLFFLCFICFTRVLIALDRTRLVGGLTLAGGVLNLILNLVCIPLFEQRGWNGALGAALATSLSLLVVAVMTGWALRVWRWIVWPDLRLFRLSLCLLAAGFCFWFTSSPKTVVGDWMAGSFRVGSADWSPLVLLGLNGVVSVGLILGTGLATLEDFALLFSGKNRVADEA